MKSTELPTTLIVTGGGMVVVVVEQLLNNLRYVIFVWIILMFCVNILVLNLR
jgi:hypothetical protein